MHRAAAIALTWLTGARSIHRFSSGSRRTVGRTWISPRDIDLGSIGKPEVLALDFDGVICASSGESSYTSVIAACRFWPGDVSVALGSKEFEMIRAGVHALRPIVETGYENMLLVRRLFNELRSTGSAKKSLDVAGLMETWSPAMRDSLLAEYGSDKNTMIKAFGDCRDSLIAEDLKFWVGLNEVYPWTLGVMRQTVDYTIVTTKQARFVEAILTSNRIAPPPKEKLFDLENPFGSKIRVLQAILRGVPATSTKTVEQMLETPMLPPSKRPLVHFVEDRVETLQAILQVPELRENTVLYLVEHGYNTHEQRMVAKNSNGVIQLLAPNALQELVNKFSSNSD